jgi:hypothetical protein
MATRMPWSGILVRYFGAFFSLAKRAERFYYVVSTSMELNYVAIIVATIVQFIIGAVWYSALFGKQWGEIHGFDKLSKETQDKMKKEMGPFYGLQILMTLITTTVLAMFVAYTSWNPFGLAAFCWIGFVFPTEVSSVIFGGTEKKWMVQKIAIQAGSIFVCLQIAAAIIYFLG